MKKGFALIKLLRPNQWIKNFILFGALVFNGQLFNLRLLSFAFLGFLTFCGLSSASYVVNDLVDLPYDKLHPEKQKRPLASGKISPKTALYVVVILVFASLWLAYSLRPAFFLISLSFFLLHLAYSFFLKKKPILDISGISASFLLRALAGEFLTGFHIPIWMMLSIAFMSLFVASCKRHSELVLEGAKTRPTLSFYEETLLNFYTSTFATATLITYALFTFLSEPPKFSEPFSEILSFAFPLGTGRKWLMLTLPFVVLGIMRYAQLVYTRKKGEAPEKVITSDPALIAILLGWAIMIVLIIYIL